MKKILVTGSIAYDVLLGYDGSFADAIKTADPEKLSVSFFSPHFTRHHGGTGANIAWNLSLLRQTPLLIGTVGHDGHEYINFMKDRGIDVSNIEVLKDHVTATAIIGTDSGERQIAFFHPGADTHGSWPRIDDDREDIACALVGARDASLMLAAVAWFKKQKVPFIFDPGQQVLALGGDELKSSALASAGVITNDFEWEMLSEKSGCSISDLLVSAPFVIVTRGENGMSIYTKEGEQKIIACTPDKVVNPTGAGDALRAGLLTGIAHQWSLVDSARLGAALASFVVEQEGTLLDAIDADVLFERARSTYGKALPSLS